MRTDSSPTASPKQRAPVVLRRSDGQVSSRVHGLLELRAEGCSTRAMDEAAASGRLGVAKWLPEDRSDGGRERRRTKAARYGHLEMVNACITTAVKGAPRLPSTMLLRKCRHRNWLYGSPNERRCANGLFNVVLYLHARRNEGCSSKAFLLAYENGHLDMLR